MTPHLSLFSIQLTVQVGMACAPWHKRGPERVEMKGQTTRNPLE
ncbi:hypothetical protein [Desulfogranum marinum]|nr:hypothetical protein [Desulfogranum marinum]